MNVPTTKFHNQKPIINLHYALNKLWGKNPINGHDDVNTWNYLSVRFFITLTFEINMLPCFREDMRFFVDSQKSVVTFPSVAIRPFNWWQVWIEKSKGLFAAYKLKNYPSISWPKRSSFERQRKTSMNSTQVPTFITMTGSMSEWHCQKT